MGVEQNQTNVEEFGNKVIWITGASSGIGEGLALAFAKCGAKVVLSGRDKNQLERVHAACQADGADCENLLILPLDITDHNSMPQALEQAVSAFGRIDILMNNAGLGARAFFLETSIEVYRRVMEVNLFGPIALTRLVLPLMIKQGSGHITVTSSVAGKVGVPLRTAYSAAKFAIIGFADALRAETAHHGIKVSTIVPGLVRTNAVATALKGDGEVIGPEEGVMNEGLTMFEAAEIILPHLARQEDEFFVGDGQEVQMAIMKRKDPQAVFRGLEKMAAQQFT
jgi:dehydrogenase/reductase SDR family protein 7|tara:strand:+ start:16792 stop:17637 length:846 start_codon:yes stop_codon:yes gene_type:complete